MQGYFITIYGINNIGKTTHAKLLVKNLKRHGIDAVYIKYPVYRLKPSGVFLNRLLRKHKKQQIPEEELQLWFVLNRYQFEPKLKALLQRGKTVVAEDYCGTGIAWGVSKGANQKELENMNKFFIQEDYAILLEGARKLNAKEKRHIHEQDDVLMRRCQRVLRQLAKKYHWKVVQVDRDPRVTAERIWGIATACVLQSPLLQ